MKDRIQTISIFLLAVALTIGLTEKQFQMFETELQPRTVYFIYGIAFTLLVFFFYHFIKAYKKVNLRFESAISNMEFHEERINDLEKKVYAKRPLKPKRKR
jgi:predicted membrane channel-forming protein YqfA (hemolysin III family)